VELYFTEQFEAAYDKLTADEKRGVLKALNLLGDNPKYSSLYVKKMEGCRNIWEARSSKRVRMTFEMKGNVILLRNVGEHDRVLKNP